MPEKEAIELVKNNENQRYEIHVDGKRVGFIEYKRDVDVMELIHTVVDRAHRGKGYAQQLADFALGDIRDTGLIVRPTCSFIASHIEQNPEYGTLVAAE